MEELIELYLFKNKKCPLPELGVLHLIDNHATALYGEGKIEAPVPTIKLIEQQMPANDFIEFIALKKNISEDAARTYLMDYCHKLQHLDAFAESKLPLAGRFYVDAEGILVFKSIEPPAIFLHTVTAERVIHPDIAHTMVVGDKETTTTEMAAYFSDSDPAAKDKWWIWAIALVVITAILFFFYFNDPLHTGEFGNAQQIDIHPDLKTYIIAE